MWCGKVIKEKKKRVKENKRPAFIPPKLYKSFNIFTKNGRNIVVESDRPLTLDEAMHKYGALSISGND